MKRFRDHYPVAPQSAINMVNLLVFTYIAPEVGVLFLCNLFVVFGFGALRTSARQTAVVWTVMVLGPGRAVPRAPTRRSGCRQAPGSDRLRHHAGVRADDRALHVSRHRLELDAAIAVSERREAEGAYRRIEELAELDELTGTSIGAASCARSTRKIAAAPATAAPARSH